MCCNGRQKRQGASATGADGKTVLAVTNVRFGFVDTKMAKALKKPLMMTPDRAAVHLLRCLETRPMQLSVPRTVAVFVRAARCIQTVTVWFS